MAKDHKELKPIKVLEELVSSTKLQDWSLGAQDELFCMEGERATNCQVGNQVIHKELSPVVSEGRHGWSPLASHRASSHSSMSPIAGGH